MMNTEHFVAIFGGAVAGSEAAWQLSRQNIRVVVFEQNSLPYGKIESGLPKWHYKLRDKQETQIDEKLDQPLVHFVPQVRLGRDLNVEDLIRNWGFSAILLATGAGMDRPLPVDGFEELKGRGLVYQNDLMDWFNHCHDPEFEGQRFQIPDETVIIGGGLASLDVAKICMIKIVQTALHSHKGILVDALTFEREGVLPYLEKQGLSLADLNVKGCTLVVRKTVEAMPLTVIPDHAGPEDLKKAGETRRKLLEKVRERFGFTVIHEREIQGFSTRDGRLASIQLRSTRAGQEGVEEEIPVPLLVSAIGSLPRPLPGLPMNGDVYDLEDPDSGRLRNVGPVFALGNAVTGRGNIQQSLIHSRRVSELIFDEYLSTNSGDYDEILEAARSRSEGRIQHILSMVKGQAGIPVEKLDLIVEKIRTLQEKSGYSGNYRKWIEEHTPPRLEQILESGEHPR